MIRLEKTGLISAFIFVCAGIGANALATVKPEVPQPTNVSAESYASSNSAASVSNVQGGNAHVSANTGDSNANNSLEVSYKDRLQAPGLHVGSVYPSSVCGTGGAFSLTVPGGSIGGSRAKAELESCVRREWFRLLSIEHKALALRVACSDPIVAAVALKGDCEYTPPLAPQPCAACEPKSDSYTKKETDERIEKAFRSTVAK